MTVSNSREKQRSVDNIDFKKQLAEDIVKFNAPIREKIKVLQKDDAYLKKVVEEGAEKARESAKKTVLEVRKIIGFRKF